MPRLPRELVLDDPRALRALAHPARAAVIDELYQGHERTASELAALTGLTASAMSYHLRALQRWGIVRPGTTRQDSRERPWARAAQRLSFTSDSTSRTTDRALTEQYVSRLRHDLAAFVEGAPEPAWADAAALSRGFAWLTPNELQALNNAVAATVRSIAGDRTADQHPVEARRITHFWATIPTPRDTTPERMGAS
ncbi:MAG: winged helix-turn-helix domain-containing protein [Mycobacteriales bacterium]